MSAGEDYRTVTLKIPWPVWDRLTDLREFRYLFGIQIRHHDLYRSLGRWIVGEVLPAWIKAEKRRQRRWARPIEAEIRERDHATALAEYEARERGEIPPEILARTRADYYADLEHERYLAQMQKGARHASR